MIYPQSRQPRQRAARLLDLRGGEGRRAAPISPGVCDPVVDALVDQVVTAQDRDDTDRRGARARPGAAVGLVPGAATGTSSRSASPTGTASAIPTSRSATASTSTPGGSIRQRLRRRRGSSSDAGRRRRRSRLMARLPAPPPAAGDPDAVRHHRHQLRGRAVRARRPGRADDRRTARQGRHVIGRVSAPARVGDAAPAPARYRGARGLDPHIVADIQQDVRLRQAAADTLLR